MILEQTLRLAACMQGCGRTALKGTHPATFHPRMWKKSISTVHLPRSDCDSPPIGPKSALIVSGSRAQAATSILIPAVDYQALFDDAKDLQGNLDARRFVPNVNATSLQNAWNDLKLASERRRELEDERLKIAEQMKKYAKNIEGGESSGELKKRGKLVREELKSVTKRIWELEETVLIPMLHLPNFIHHNTPLNEGKTMYEHKQAPKFEFTTLSHIQLGKRANTIFFSHVSPTAYYLKNSAALFEMACLEYFTNAFCTAGFQLFSGPDFCKPVVVEGCGYNFTDPEEVFILKSKDDERIENCNSLHLCGSSSTMTFCAYYTKMVIGKRSLLPFRHVSVGRHFQPNPIKGTVESKNAGLFNVSQTSRCSYFISSENENQRLESNHDEVVELLKTCYVNLDLHFRITNVPAHQLSRAESRRTSFEMLSPYFKTYIEIGNVSVFDDYISRRLISQYQDGNERKFLGMMHGVAVDIPKLLGCIMENTQTSNGNFAIPSIFQY